MVIEIHCRGRIKHVWYANSIGSPTHVLLCSFYSKSSVFLFRLSPIYSLA